MQSFYVCIRDYGEIRAVKRSGWIKKINGYQVGFYRSTQNISPDHRKHYSTGEIFWYPIDLKTGLSFLKITDDRAELKTLNKAIAFITGKPERMDEAFSSAKYADYVNRFKNLTQNAA